MLARIPEGSWVMTNASVTLDQTGIADAISDAAGRWEPARNKRLALDFATQAQQMKAIGGQPGYACRGYLQASQRDEVRRAVVGYQRGEAARPAVPVPGHGDHLLVARPVAPSREQLTAREG